MALWRAIPKKSVMRECFTLLCSNLAAATMTINGLHLQALGDKSAETGEDGAGAFARSFTTPR